MNEHLQYIVDNLDIISQLYDREVILSVMDRDKIVRGFSLPQGIPPQLEIGSVFEDPSGIFDEVIAKGVTRHNYLPKEVMGFPIEGNLVPVKDNGQVVGCVSQRYCRKISEFHSGNRRLHSGCREWYRNLIQYVDEYE